MVSYVLLAGCPCLQLAIGSSLTVIVQIKGILDIVELMSWLVSFYICLGVCNALVAELKGLIHGLTYAWEHDFRQAKVNVDFRPVLDLLNQGMTWNYQLQDLILQYQALLRRVWRIQLVHYFQKANSVADYFC
uniref:RNase H type-1 domain-containing protein n=1 Tax=Manihot esculenta TaxID=3983 RepID=A0A2C9V2B0_MANES